MTAAAVRRRASARPCRFPTVLLVVVLVLVSLAAACGSGSGQTSTPGPGVTLTTSPTPSPTPPSVHTPSVGEKLALTKAAFAVEHPKTDEDRQRFKGYSVEGMAITGYLVQLRAPGLLIAVLVDARDASIQAAGPLYGSQPWGTKGRRQGPGEAWALATAERELAPVLAKLEGESDVERAVCGYVVGWPQGRSLTLWFDLKGTLRGAPQAE